MTNPSDNKNSLKLVADDKSPVAAKKRSYVQVSNAKRLQIIDLIDHNMSLKEVSESLNVNYDNVSRIYRIYRFDCRVQKGVKGKKRNSNKYT